MKQKQQTSAQLALPDPVAERLDVLIQILLPPVPTGVSEVQAAILKLCDYNHTHSDIAEKIGKTSTHLNKELSVLRARGLVRTVSRDAKQVIVRLAN